jgi:signal transduction histidine kinase
MPAKRQHPWWMLAFPLTVVVVVGSADYITGHEILFSTFYMVAVGFSAWFVGRMFAIVISVLSVGASLVGDLAAGAAYSHPFVPAWNALITLTTYLVVVWLLSSLRNLYRELEERVSQRTMALTQEMAERARLEWEILEVSERERRRIGHDLHDSLGQHLTGTALAGQVLQEKLAARMYPEAGAAARIVTLIEEAIGLTRSMARGLHPVEVEGGGLAEGLRELAASVSTRFGVRCEFEGDGGISIEDPSHATHLYRIAQEAISNAIKHGKARHITIEIRNEDDGVRLSVHDDGVGIAEPVPHGNGMGLRIMAHRARLIGSALGIRRDAAGGTVVTCLLPGSMP